MIEMNRSFAEFGIESMRVRYSYVPLPVYKKGAELFLMFAERIKKFGPLQAEKRKAVKEKLGI
jgi:coenzyme F420-reducing hydrogenase delta subunit